MKLLRKGGAGRGALLITIGTAVGQGLSALSSPVLARIYSPAEFGVFSTALAVGVILSTAASWRLESAIPVAQKDEEADGLFSLAIGFSFLTLTVLAVGWLALHGFVPLLDVEPLVVLGTILVALGYSTFRCANQFAIRFGEYGKIGLRNAIQSAVLVVAQVALGLVGFGSTGLIFGFFIGYAVGTAIMLRGTRLLERISVMSGAGAARAKLSSVARKYKAFPLYFGPAAVVNIVGIQIQVIIIAHFYSAGETGQFGMAQKILALPVTLIGTAISQVFLGEFARAARGHRERLAGLFMRGSKALTLAAVPVGILIVALGPWVFPLVLGSPWQESGELARVMSIMLTLQFISAPLSQTLIVLERAKTQLAWDCTRLVAVVLAITIPASAGLALSKTVFYLSLVSALMYMVSWTLSWRAVNSVRSNPEDS